MTLRCGKDGKVLLYGTGCVRCDCPGAVLELDGTTTREQAERIARHQRDRDASDAFAYMASAFMGGAKRDRDAHMAAQQKRIREAMAKVVAEDLARKRDEAFASAMFGGNPYAGQQSGTWQGTATMAPVEIITDPADQRGLAARPARVPQ